MNERIGITVLGSGSRGNSIVVHSCDQAILVDAGFSRKETLARLSSAGIRAETIAGILVSHEHGDHVDGIRLLSDELGIPAFGSSGTMRRLIPENKIGKVYHVFESGSTFQIASFSVKTFSVPHDALDPVAFVISRSGFRVGIATDLGHLNHLCIERLRGCDALVLEANHDLEMQKKSERHIRLKRRVLGKHGHLSNNDSVNSFPLLLTEKTKFLCLAHLSSECNSPELLREIASQKLAEMSREDILLGIAGQKNPLQTFWLGDEDALL